LLQNLSPGRIGLPHAVQSRAPAGAAATGALMGGGGGGGGGNDAGEAGAGSFTITRHLLQYLLPGWIGLPHAVQSMGPAGAAATGAIAGAIAGGGGGGGAVPPIGAPQEPQNFMPEGLDVPHAGQKMAGWVEGAGAGCGGGMNPIFAPQEPQNFSSGPMTLPHDGQVRAAGSATGMGVGAVSGAGTASGAGVASS